MFEATDVLFGIQRTAMAAIGPPLRGAPPAVMRVGLGRAGEFNMPNGLQSAQLIHSSYDFMTAEGRLPRSAASLFPFTILSKTSVSLVVIDTRSKAQVAVTQLSTPIKVKIAIDQNIVAQGTQSRYGASCAHYIRAQPGDLGGLSFDGCTAVERNQDFVECECTHLTEFVAAIDPTIQACGDGIIQAGDECDDGNTASEDGCSPSCKIEKGASCWRTGTPPIEKSECCAPCNAGSYRKACTYMSADGADGICSKCPVNTYKPARGSWNTQCADCPAGQLSGLGASSCEAEAPCAVGFYRPQEGESCRACLLGTYKTGQGAEQCVPFASCPPGRELQGYSITTPGTCEPCPESTYKDTIGFWSTRCTPCPTGSSSITKGNKQRDSCECTTGYQQSTAAPPAFCQDVDECLATPCPAVNKCINLPGTYACASHVCGDGFTVSDEKCDDKNLANSGDQSARSRPAQASVSCLCSSFSEGACKRRHRVKGRVGSCPRYLRGISNTDISEILDLKNIARSTKSSPPPLFSPQTDAAARALLRPTGSVSRLQKPPCQFAPATPLTTLPPGVQNARSSAGTLPRAALLLSFLPRTRARSLSLDLARALSVSVSLSRACARSVFLARSLSRSRSLSLDPALDLAFSVSVSVSLARALSPSLVYTDSFTFTYIIAHSTVSSPQLPIHMWRRGQMRPRRQQRRHGHRRGPLPVQPTLLC